MTIDVSNRQYIIISVEELSLVEFDKIIDENAQFTHKNFDRTKAILRIEGTLPDFVNNLNTKEGPYNRKEIMSLLKTPEINWYNWYKFE